MGFVGGLLGTAGGAGGSGFSTPQSANIERPTTVKQAQTSYTDNQNALAQQQAFLQAVQQQNGLQNQTDVYNQLKNIAAGQGPNPAQAQLAQATGANVANQAALMAGQRGANANVGLLARQAAQQGANTQQQSAGQAATLQAQQSLGAIQNMGNLANTQAAQQAAATGAVTGAQQAEQNALLNSINAQNNAAVGMQSNINQGNAALAGQQMANQGNLLGGAIGAVGGLASMFAKGGEIPRKMYASGQYVDSQPLTDDQWNQAAAGQPMPVVPVQQPQVMPIQQSSVPSPEQSQGPKSKFAQFLSSMSNQDDSKPTGYRAAGDAIGKGIISGIKSLAGNSDDNTNQKYLDADVAMSVPGGNKTVQMQASNDVPGMMAAKGGKVPALVSPGEQYLPPKDVEKVKKGANPLKVGEKIPGKPKYPGNDYRNDIIPKKLESGGIVIPNKVIQSKNPHWEAMKFVHATLKKPKKPSK